MFGAGGDRFANAAVALVKRSFVIRCDARLRSTGGGGVIKKIMYGRGTVLRRMKGSESDGEVRSVC